MKPWEILNGEAELPDSLFRLPSWYPQYHGQSILVSVSEGVGHEPGGRLRRSK